MKYELKTITIAITRYLDGYFKYYDIETKEDLNEAIESFEEKYNQHDGDWEIQCVDWSYEGFKDSMLNDFLNLVEDFPNENPQDIIYLLNMYTVNDTRDILEQGVFYIVIEADNKYEAFETYIKVYDVVEIPEHLECFIDFEAMCESYTCGSLNVERVAQGRYLVISY